MFGLASSIDFGDKFLSEFVFLTFFFFVDFRDVKGCIGNGGGTIVAIIFLPSVYEFEESNVFGELFEGRG